VPPGAGFEGPSISTWEGPKRFPFLHYRTRGATAGEIRVLKEPGVGLVEWDSTCGQAQPGDRWTISFYLLGAEDSRTELVDPGLGDVRMPLRRRREGGRPSGDPRRFCPHQPIPRYTINGP